MRIFVSHRSFSFCVIICAFFCALLFTSCSKNPDDTPDPNNITDNTDDRNDENPPNPNENENGGSSSEKEILPLLITMKNWVLTHAPYHKYDPKTNIYDGDIKKAGSVCHAIRFLCRYYTTVSEDVDVYNKILELADFAMSQQYIEDESAGHYGAFISSAGSTDNYYYATNAAQCGRALLYTYRITEDPKHKTASINAANFLMRMQDPTLGGIYEYYHAGVPHPVKNQINTKLLMALPFFKALYEETQDEQYKLTGEKLRNSVLTYGLENGYEYFEIDMSPDRAGDNKWHRKKEGDEERYMFADSASFAIRGIFEYEGSSDWLKNIYEFYNSFTGGDNAPDYNPDICWAGYLSPETKTIDKNGHGYYDMVNIGILMPYRKDNDVDAYELSRQMMFDNPENAMYWGLRLNYEVEDISPWQNNISISNIAEGLVQTNPYK